MDEPKENDFPNIISRTDGIMNFFSIFEIKYVDVVFLSHICFKISDFFFICSFYERLFKIIEALHTIISMSSSLKNCIDINS